jgi:hypothetical protein
MIRTAFACRQVAPCSAATMLSSSKLRGAISLVLGALPRRGTSHLARAVPMGAAWVSSTVASPQQSSSDFADSSSNFPRGLLARPTATARAGCRILPLSSRTERHHRMFGEPVGTLCERLMGVLECLVD